MEGLKSVLLTLQGKPYIPNIQDNSPFRRSPLVLGLRRGSSSWSNEGYHVATAVTREGRNVGMVGAQEWAEGWWEIQQANVDSFRQGEGIAQALYMILAEAAPQGIIPNITESVSDSAARVWASLSKYGTITKLEPSDRLMMGLVDEDEADSSSLDKFTSWDDVVSRGLDVNFSHPLPPEGYSSWRELVIASGGTWEV